MMKFPPLRFFHRQLQEHGRVGRLLFGIRIPLFYLLLPVVLVPLIVTLSDGDPLQDEIAEGGADQGDQVVREVLQLQPVVRATGDQPFQEPMPEVPRPPPAPPPDAQLQSPLPATPRQPPVAVSPDPVVRSTPAPAKTPPLARREPEPPAAINRPDPGGINGADWLLAQSGQLYTVQLLGTHEERTLRGYVRKHRLSGTAYYRIERKGRPWYVLVYGLYSDREQARRAIVALPAAVRANNPWPRRIDAVQQSIRKREG
jgi:septal ring-binding cell division protein DamX